MGGRASRSQSWPVSGTQTTPEEYRMVKARSSGVASSAAKMRSPSFSRSSSSTATTGWPAGRLASCDLFDGELDGVETNRLFAGGNAPGFHGAPQLPLGWPCYLLTPAVPAAWAACRSAEDGQALPACRHRFCPIGGQEFCPPMATKLPHQAARPSMTPRRSARATHFAAHAGGFSRLGQPQLQLRVLMITAPSGAQRAPSGMRRCRGADCRQTSRVANGCWALDREQACQRR